MPRVQTEQTHRQTEDPKRSAHRNRGTTQFLNAISQAAFIAIAARRHRALRERSAAADAELAALREELAETEAEAAQAAADQDAILVLDMRAISGPWRRNHAAVACGRAAVVDARPFRTARIPAVSHAFL